MSKIVDRNSIVALALGAALGVLAILPAAAQGTPAQRMACTGDAMSLCSADVPDVGRITACLRRERAHVSAAPASRRWAWALRRPPWPRPAPG